jgi:threonylcarbamoyladenosine tRNA methylthiotransferase MtaB
MKVYLDSIGCRLNQSEIEIYARQFAAAGHQLVPEPGEADLAVVNTCSVTAAAASDSRQKVRQISRSGVDNIVVTGCWSSLHPESAAALPAVSHVVPNRDKDTLVANLLSIPEIVFELEPVARQAVPGARLRTRAFIKVQDGCDNRCTFCVTTLARGPGRSRSISSILADIRAALVGDPDGRTAAKEIVLTGVHLGSWGQDLSPPLHLRHLVQAILEGTSGCRIRLSSLEPWDLDDSFFTLWQDPRLCRHLHLPLQSGCSATLRRMARKTTPAAFAALVHSARRAVPEMAITTDVITGFPGETEREFLESLSFIQQMSFAGGHVFTYSARQGTAAARMPDQVPHPIRKDRNARLHAIFAKSAHQYQERFLGKDLDVLWESVTELGSGQWHMSGLTDNYLRINARAPQFLWNQITPVHLLRSLDGEIEGRLVGNVQPL